MATKEKTRNTGWRELWGIILMTGAALLILSLWSYDWADIPLLRTPPNNPPLNIIGPAGAWTILVALMLLGLGAFLLPVLLVALGLFLLLHPQKPFLGRFCWGILVLLTVTALIALYPDSNVELCRRMNIQNLPGGMFGRLFAEQSLARLLGHTGAAIMLIGLLSAGLVMLIGRATFVTLGNMTVAAARELAERAHAARLARRDRLENLAREARALARQRALLEKSLPRNPVTPRPTPPEPPPLAQAPEPEPDPEPPSKPFTPPITREPALATAPVQRAPVTINAETPPYQLPALDLLCPTPKGHEREIDADVHTTAKILTETLAEFGIECQVTNVEQGPVVTRYELRPAPGVRVENIVKLQNNLQLVMKATSVRVQAPIPGKDVVGVEVPNAIATKVYLRDILEGEQWSNARAAIPLVLGKDVGGSDLIADLATMPHLLIAGATGSGKTVCMNSILAGILMSRTPYELRLILVDPKIVEFSVYNDLPHLATPVITDHKKVIFGLRWAINEMNKRYKLFARLGVRNIASYNERMQTDPPAAGTDPEAFPPHVPYVVIVIDELADLMMVARAEIENSIARLAQLSRAVGIHMILATQRPSVNVITGTIKANFPARISFQVAQKVDSRTILDTSGADKLLGRGDMLILPPGSSKLIRAQGAMTTDEDIHNIVQFIKQQAIPPQHEITIAEDNDIKIPGLPGLPGGDDDADDADSDLLDAATNIIRETRRASVSLLQRRLKIGYNRAGRLMDVLEERGIVGPACGSDPREILIDLDVHPLDNNVETDTNIEGNESIAWNQSDKS